MNLITPMQFPITLSLSLRLSQKLFPQQGMNNNQNDKTWYKYNEKRVQQSLSWAVSVSFPFPDSGGNPT